MYFSDFDNEKLKTQLGGERFSVRYRLFGSEDECRSVADEICVEQSVEFPKNRLPQGEIVNQILGHLESFEQPEDGVCEVVISYAAETAASEFTQFLNVVFGNFSIKPNVKVIDISLCGQLFELINGPRFGIEGLRGIIKAEQRPLLFTALKPMGLSSSNFANMANTFARNGIDIIKDDHGLSNQSFSPFEERVRLCGEAVGEANAATGRHSIYVPNITAPISELRDRALYAKEHGAGGLMLAPGLIGFEAMKSIADDDEIALPVFAHPAFSGSSAINPQGFSLQMFYGMLMRLAGADASIFPNYGGRFSFSVEECVGIAQQGKRFLGSVKPMFSCPAGGMTLERIPDMLRNYGNDVIILIGGGLFSGEELSESCRSFVEAATGCSTASGVSSL